MQHIVRPSSYKFEWSLRGPVHQRVAERPKPPQIIEPMYPYVSVCIEAGKTFLDLDPALTQQTDSYEALLSENSSEMVWSAVKVEKSGELVLKLIKNPTPKFKAILSFNTGLETLEPKYHCQ